MTRLFCILTLSCLPSEPDGAISGYLSHYAEQPTIATVAYRQRVGDIPYDLSPYAGLIAVADCTRVGHEAWLEVEHRWLPVIAFDCAGDQATAAWMDRDRILGEVDFNLATALGFGRGGVAARMAWREDL